MSMAPRCNSPLWDIGRNEWTDVIRALRQRAALLREGRDPIKPVPRVAEAWAEQLERIAEKISWIVFGLEAGI